MTSEQFDALREGDKVWTVTRRAGNPRAVVGTVIHVHSAGGSVVIRWRGGVGTDVVLHRDAWQRELTAAGLPPDEGAPHARP